MFALSLRPLLLFFPLLLLQSSSLSQGGSVHPYILRLQQLSCKAEKMSSFAGKEFSGDKPLMFSLIDNSGVKLAAAALATRL